MDATDGLKFGDDINSTPIASIQQPAMSSRKDAPPVEPPVYDPNVSFPEERHVRFDIPEKTHKKKKKHRRERRDHREPQYMWQPPPVPPAPVPPPPSKKKKLLEFLMSHSHAMVVFALTALVLWYLPRIANLPYLGGAEGLSTVGIAFTAVAVAVAYSIFETLVD